MHRPPENQEKVARFRQDVEQRRSVDDLIDANGSSSTGGLLDET